MATCLRLDETEVKMHRHWGDTDTTGWGLRGYPILVRPSCSLPILAHLPIMSSYLIPHSKNP